MNRTTMKQRTRRGVGLGLAALALLWIAAATTVAHAADDNNAARPARLQCEALVNPPAVDAQPPTLSWIVNASRRGETQTAYQVRVASTPELLAGGKADLWDSGKVAGDQTRIAYGGTPLKSLQACHWQVRVWDKDGRESPWSAPAAWTMGLLEPSDWKGQWIGDAAAAPMLGDMKKAKDEKRSFSLNAPWLRKTFEVEHLPSRALVHVASLGLHEVYLNGVKVGSDVLSPSETLLQKRLLYVTYDVTALLKPGRNCLAVWLGIGVNLRYRLEHGPAVLAQLTMMNHDRPNQIVATDNTWKTYSSPLSHYWSHGRLVAGGFPCEHFNALADKPEWNAPNFDDTSWPAASVIQLKTPVLNRDLGVQPIVLNAENIQPNRITEEFPAVGVENLGNGIFEVDMGRCFVGRIRMSLKGPRGRNVWLRFYDKPKSFTKRTSIEGAEDFARRFDTFFQDDCIVLSGGADVFTQRFVYRGFRWMTIEGLDVPPRADEIVGQAIHTDYPRRGSFACSNDMLTWIGNTMACTFRGLSIGGFLADCSTREKKGYGAEGEYAMEFGWTRFDLEAFSRKWLRDWRDTQNPEGNIATVAPQVHHYGWTIWPAFLVMQTWFHYQEYGDVGVVRENFPAIERFLTYLANRRKSGLVRDEHYNMAMSRQLLGDWASAYGGSVGQSSFDAAVREVFNNCYLVDVLEKAAELAEVVDRTADAGRFRTWAEEMRKTLHQEFYDPKTHAYALAEQPYFVLPLVAGVPPAAIRPDVEAALEYNIVEKRKGHNYSGVAGTYHLFRYLTLRERHDLIYTMLTKTAYPSFGFMREKGATAIWEYWNECFQSQIHSSYTNITWLTDGLAGLRRDPASPGWGRAIIKPAIVGDVTWVKCVRDTVRGQFVGNWQITDGKLTMEVTVPANATATVHVPTSDPASVREGGGPAAKAEGVRKVETRAGEAVIEIGSGSYVFTAPAPAPIKAQPANNTNREK